MSQPQTDTPRISAIRYALALMRGRLDVEAPFNADVIRGYIDELESLLTEAAPSTPPATTWQANVDPGLPPLEQVAEALRQKAEQEEWARWLKDGETPLERVKREHADNQMLLKELARVKMALEATPPAEDITRAKLEEVLTIAENYLYLWMEANTSEQELKDAETLEALRASLKGPHGD